MIASRRVRHKVVVRLLVTVALTGAALLIDANDILRRWNDLYYDVLVQFDNRPAPDDIVIVAIDQRSLLELGRWPWSRGVHARLVEQLTRQGAGAIVFDVLFAEPDPGDPTGDRRLVAAVAANGRVVFPVAAEAAESHGYLTETLPFPALAAVAADLGHVDLELSSDGQARHVFLHAGIGHPYWPHLAVAALRVVESKAEPRIAPPLSDVGAPVPGSQLAWQRRDFVGIPYSGPPGHFRRVSYIDVLHGRVPDAVLNGRIVLIGATATGVGEVLPTPVSDTSDPMTGVEIVANVLEALRKQQFYKPLSTSAQLGATVAVVFSLAWISIMLLQLGRRLLPILLVVLPLLLCAVLLLVGRRWFDPMPAFLSLAVAYPLYQWRDIGALARTLALERNAAKTTLQMLAEAVLTADQNARVRYLNPAAEQLTGWTADEATGRRVEEVFRAYSENRRRPFQPPGDQQQTRDLATFWVLTRRDGTHRVVRASFARGAEGAPDSGVVMTFSDVTTERQLAEQIQYQASHDALTELPNRNLLNDRLQHAVARAHRNEGSIAVLFTDLDDFKKVNDSLGHVSGDTLLRIVAKRLRESVRDEDTVARISGDEFVILVEQLADTDTAITIAQKLVDAARQPLSIDDHEITLTTSVGLCFYPQDGTTIADLMKNADLAMYSAKAKGGNTVAVYQSEMNRHAFDRFTLENDLQHALERHEFQVHYQPLFDLATAQIIGAEALVRWAHPQRGLLAPSTFIASAERSRLIEPIGEWVLRTACIELKRWQRLGRGSLRVAVNLSPRQLEDPSFPETVAAILRETDTEPSAVELEITEEVVMADAHGERETLRRLSRLGVGLAIDDFGTGYSSFSYLRRFPVSRLKIDRSFINELDTHADDAAIVRAIVALAKSLHLSTTAEGVETETQAQFLRDIDCSECQGFFFGRPVTSQAFERLLLNCPTVAANSHDGD